MNNANIQAAANLIADFDPAFARLWLAQPFSRHAMVTAFDASLRKSLSNDDLVDRISVFLRSAIDSTKVEE